MVHLLVPTPMANLRYSILFGDVRSSAQKTRNVTSQVGVLMKFDDYITANRIRCQIHSQNTIIGIKFINVSSIRPNFCHIFFLNAFKIIFFTEKVTRE